MLPREVRCSFFQKRQLHFELAVTAFQFPDPLLGWHIRRQRLPGEFLPVTFHPKAEGGIIDTEFSRYLGDWQRVIDHPFRGLLLKLRSVPFRFPWHSVPSFPVEILIDPCPETPGHLNRLFVIMDNLSANKTPAIRRWAKRENVELCFTPTSASWANPIEAQFGPVRTFVMANSDYRNHPALARRLQDYLRWRNAHARHPDVLAAQRRERARIRSERQQRWGRPKPKAA
jgi:hypothetical protein